MDHVSKITEIFMQSHISIFHIRLYLVEQVLGNIRKTDMFI